ncbi:MAG: signal peptidase I [Sphingomicrobium sp.]
MASNPDPITNISLVGRLGASLRFLVILAALAWAMRSFIVAPFSIPTGSMVPTMLPGDYLFVTKWNYGFSRFSFPGNFPPFEGRILNHIPERGDIVVFKRPDAIGADWVKRVVGLPGDTIELRGGAVVLNGKPIPRQARAAVTIPASPNVPCRAAPGAVRDTIEVAGKRICRYRAFNETLPNGRRYTVLDQLDSGPGDWFGPKVVPTGHVFLMGDNRDDSADSRFGLAAGGIGIVPVDRLVGRAAFAFWSTDGTADLVKPWTWITALRTDRLGLGYE